MEMLATFPNLQKLIYWQLAPVVSVRQYGVVIRDFDMRWPADDDWPQGVAHVSRPTYRRDSPNLDKVNEAGKMGMGLPATCRNSGDMVVKMTERLQQFLHKTNCERVGLWVNNQYAKDSFAKLIRSNAWAFDRHAPAKDYINGYNLEADDLQNIVMLTSGAVMEILGDEVKWGVDSWVVKAINVLRDDLGAYGASDVTLWSNPTNSRRERVYTGLKYVYRENIVTSFPMYNNKAIMWLFSNQDYVYMPKNRVQLIRSLDERPPVLVA